MASMSSKPQSVFFMGGYFVPMISTIAVKANPVEPNRQSKIFLNFELINFEAPNDPAIMLHFTQKLQLWISL